VRVLDEGLYPDTRFVRYSNYCDIGLKVFGDGRIVLISAIDNLVKGASGQAVQNMNITLGLDEAKGLERIPQYP
jgi:N-acetyl-gamma-glutamyl-phosphate reductase